MKETDLPGNGFSSSGAGRPRRARVAGRTIAERNAIVLKLQWLVRAVARGYRGRGLEFADLVSEGQFGLIRAAELYDPLYGASLVMFAKRWISQSIAYAIAARGSLVSVPHGVRALAGKFRKQRRASDGAPDEIEIGRFLAECHQRLRASTLRAGLKARGLRRAAWPGTATFSPAASTRRTRDSAITRVDDRDWAESVLAKLPEREAAIVRARFGIDLDGSGQALREVGRQFGIGHKRARQLSDRALGRLRGWASGSSGVTDSPRADYRNRPMSQNNPSMQIL